MKALCSLNTIFKKYLKNFENFENFEGFEFFEISEYGFFLQQNWNPSYISFESTCYGDFKNIKTLQKFWNFSNLAGGQKKFFFGNFIFFYQHVEHSTLMVPMQL